MHPVAPVPHLTVRARHRRPRTFLGRLVESVAAAFALPAVLAGALAVLFATRLNAVGVTVLTGVQPGPSETISDPGMTYFVVGLAERGDTTNPILVRSMAEYAEKLGERVTYGSLFDDLQTAFSEGVSRAYVARIVGASATKGTKALVDRAGTPLTTITLTAKNAGAWSSDMTVQVLDGAITNTFTIKLFLDGELKETYADEPDPATAVTDINNRSSLVTAANNSSATAAPNNNPAVLAATAFSAGSDDRGSLVSSDYTAALARFGPELGSGDVCIPGQASSAVGAGLIAHAKANRRIAYLFPASGTSVASAQTAAAALRATTGSEHAGFFFPWVKVPDGSGGERTISPGGYVAGCRARAIRTGGPWRAVMGEIAVARYVTGLERTLTRSEVNDLVDSRVNPIRQVAGTARLYGWRSMSVDQVNYISLTGRDTLNVFADQAEAALEEFVGRPVDSKGHLFVEMGNKLAQILEPMRAAGGLYERRNDNGDVIDPGYIIDTGPSVNTAQVLANNEVRADVGLRVSPSAELITLTITKVAFDSSL